MGIRRGPNVVSSGLLYYLDSANTFCYTSGSATCSDLIDSNRIGNIYSGVSFNESEAAGSWVFDGGASASIDVPALDNVTDFSISIWFQVTGDSEVGSTGYNTLIGNLIGGDNRILINSAGSNNRRVALDFSTPDSVIITNSTTSLDEWNNVVFAYNNTTGTGSLYVNNELSVTPIEDSTISYNNTAHFLGGSKLPIENYAMNGFISSCAIYDRVLSAAEVSQNYNALKTRFGL